MLVDYCDVRKEFICYTLPGESKFAKDAGFWRRRNGCYYTKNFSIARSLLFFARGATRDMLLNWKPQSNKESRHIAIAPPPDGLNYLSHQPEGILFALDRKRALIADEMRVGKMIQIAGYIRSLLQADYKRVLVVMHAKMVETARKALDLWTGNNCIALSKKITPFGDNVCIASYDRVRIDLELIKEWIPDVIVCDEAHLIKNEFAKRTIALKELIQQADKVLFATGTPAPNGLKETFFLLNILDEERFSSYYNHKENIKQYINDVLIRRTRAQVFDMPLKTRRYIYLTQEGISKHIKAELKAFKKWGGRNDLPFNDFSRARREAAQKKIPIIKKYLDGELPGVIQRNEKILIGCYHLNVMDQLVEHIKNKYGDQSVVLINGETTTKQDQQSMEQFNNNPECIAMVCSQRSVLGQTFNIASNVVVAEFDYVPANLEQFEDRVFHFEQSDKQVNIDYLVVEDSFDQHMLKVLEEKAKDIEKVFSEVY